MLIGTMLFITPTIIYIANNEESTTWSLLENLFYLQVHWLVGCSLFIINAILYNYQMKSKVLPWFDRTVWKERWHYASFGFLAGSVFFLLYTVLAIFSFEIDETAIYYYTLFLIKAILSTLGSIMYFIGSYAMVLDATKPSHEQEPLTGRHQFNSKASKIDKNNINNNSNNNNTNGHDVNESQDELLEGGEKEPSSVPVDALTLPRV